MSGLTYLGYLRAVHLAAYEFYDRDWPLWRKAVWPVTYLGCMLFVTIGLAAYSTMVDDAGPTLADIDDRFKLENPPKIP